MQPVRRSFSVLALLAMLLSSAFVAPATTLAVGPGPCDPGGPGFGSLYAPESNVWETMVQADIYVDSSRFTPCTDNFTFHGGISQWVSLEFHSPGLASPNSIVQVGVIKCGQENGFNDPLWEACSNSHQNTLSYFLAYGHDDNSSCGWGMKKSTAIWIANAPTTPDYHNFKVQYKVATDRVWFLIDDLLVGNIDAGAYCWLNSPYSKATYALERWNGGDGATAVHFDNTRYEKNDDGVTRVASWASTTSCNLDPEFRCARTSGDHFIFSVN